MTDLGEYPSLENLIEQAGANGWDFFDGPQRRADARAAIPETEAERAAAIAAALYQTPQFQELLAFLCKASLHRQTFMSPMGLDPMQGYAYGVFREGQNSMVFSIFKLIAEGRYQILKGRDA